MIGRPFSQHDVGSDVDNGVRDPADGAIGGGGGPGGMGVDDIRSCKQTRISFIKIKMNK